MKRFALLLLFAVNVHAAVRDVASASSITLHGTGVYRITGTATIDNILGVSDGDQIILLPAAAFALSGAGNVAAVDATATAGRPMIFEVANGIVYQLGPSIPSGGGGGGGAPTTATYITQQPDATLLGEQALSALATGIMYSTTGFGTVSIAVPGTDYYNPGGTDVAIGDGGTGQSTKLLGFNALSPLTTKGDVIAHNGTNNVRVAVGADGTILTADSTAAEGVRFAPVALGTEYNEDTADADAEKLTMAGVRRSDTAASTAGTDGDRTVFEVDALGRLWVNGSSVTQPVSGTFWQATQPVSGTFWQATQPVSGTVTANAGTNLNTSALALDATLTGGTQTTRVTDGTNTATVKAASTAAGATDKALVVAISPNNTIPVSGTFWQATQPVSGTVTTTPPANASTNVAQMNGVATTMGNGIAGTGVQRVAIASDNTAFPVNATLQTGTNTVGSFKLTDGTNTATVVAGGLLATIPFNSSGVEMKSSTTTPAGTELALITRNIPSGTQDVNNKQINGVTLSTGNGSADTGTQRVSIAQELTYSAGTTAATATAAGTGVFFSVCGSATKTVQIQRLSISGTVATGAKNGDVIVSRTSAATSAGTATTLTVAPFDSNSAAGTAVAKYYTVLATAGTLAAVVDTGHLYMPLTGTGTSTTPLWWRWRDQDSQSPTLRGTAQCLEAKFGTTTTNAPTLAVSVVWTEK